MANIAKKMLATSFTYNSVRVEIPAYLSSTLGAEQVQKFPPFVRWFERLQASLASTASGGVGKYYQLKNIEIQSADFFAKGTKLGFLKIKALVEDDTGSSLPGIVLLRGQSVAILVLVYPSLDPAANNPADYDDIIITIQPRIAGADMAMAEIPAGMYDPEDNRLSFAAQRELKEECGIEVVADDMRPLLSAAADRAGGIFPSAGALDEQLQFFYCRKLMHARDIEELEGRAGGAEDEREKITLKVVPLSDLITATLDAKAIIAAALYNNLAK
ncbi:hypothetical protein BZA70DRAFT_252882 [Myxozyma melibiosi]|uniref:Nudix hydrolase domain-containing protein n=1 Tax=Myxozyma melibiosi TaxID=54550 RepID=A0ABR1FBH1_9ASCO